MASSSSSSATATKKSGFAKRRLTIMKKAYELSTLCGTDVCVICYGPDGELETWPKNIAKVRDMAEKYKGLSESEKRKKRLDLSGFLGKMKLDDEKKCHELESKFPSWDKRLDGYSTQELSELERFLENKAQRLKERVEFLEMKKQEDEDKDHTRKYSSFCPPVPSNSEVVISPIPGDRQEQPALTNLPDQIQFPTLPYDYYPQCQMLAGNVGFNNHCYQGQNCFMGSSSGNWGTTAPYFGNNNGINVSDFNQSLISQTEYQNLLANDMGIRTEYQNILTNGMGIRTEHQNLFTNGLESYQTHHCDFLGTTINDINIGNYSSIMMPQGYCENVHNNNSNNLLMMNSFNNPQLQFRHLSNATPQLAPWPFLAWNPQQQPFKDDLF